MQLYLIRHTQPQVRRGICYGASDLPLAADPLAVATRLRPLLPADAPVFTSPLRRCLGLAERLADAPLADARLAEIDFGEWELRHWDDIGADAVGEWAADPIGFTPPGGECPRDVLARALDFVDGLLVAGLPNACVVTHGGIIRLLAGHWQGLPESRWAELHFAFGRVSAFDVSLTEGRRSQARPFFLDA